MRAVRYQHVIPFPRFASFVDCFDHHESAELSVRTCRWFGKLGFVSLEDASGRLQLQLARDTLRGGADGADAVAGAARSVAHAKRPATRSA